MGSLTLVSLETWAFFHLWIEEKEAKYETDVHAKLNGKDYTDLLNKLGIDIASFGHYDTEMVGEKEVVKGDIARLSRQRTQELSHIGLLADEEESFPNEPLWTVLKTYHWTQTFPAHKVLHVRHEYTPSVGWEDISPEELDPTVPDRSGRREQIDNACVDPSLRKGLIDQTKKYGPPIVSWVDYILTTANSWKTPIKDFTLVIDKRRGQQFPTGGAQYVSLCWNGPIKKLDADHFLAHKIDYVPKQELHVVFFASSLK
jgi:hypothetical protein